MKQVLKAAVGLALVLAWWHLRGDGSASESTDRIPSVVWDGSGGSITIQADTTCPARMRVSFSDHAETDAPRSLESYEDVPAGKHTWTIAVPAQVGGYVELEADSPHPGDRLSWAIKVGGNAVDEQSETLERPLESGTAFFIQSYFDDYASGTLGEG